MLRLRLVAIATLFAGLYLMSVSPGRASGDAPTSAPGTFKVLIIGNSHVFVNDVPSRLRQLLKAHKGSTSIQAITRGGARLISFTHRADAAHALKSEDWDVIVLQEATASFLSAPGRRSFHLALRWFSERIPTRTRIVLYQTWPWRADSRYFAGTSSNAEGLWQAMQHEYAIAAKLPRTTIAPVGQCWMRSARRASFYSHDGNHASIAGSTLAAHVLAATIADPKRQGC